MATEIEWDYTGLMRAAFTDETLDRLMESANNIADEARSTGPETRNPSYVPSIRTTWGTARTIAGYYVAYVIASRHEMVIEFGWHDLKGKWHPGKFILTNALKKEGKR